MYRRACKSQPGISSDYQKYMERYVVIQKSSTTSEMTTSGSTPARSRPTTLSASRSMRSIKESKKPTKEGSQSSYALNKMVSSPRSGLMPADTFQSTNSDTEQSTPVTPSYGSSLPPEFDLGTTSKVVVRSLSTPLKVVNRMHALEHPSLGKKSLSIFKNSSPIETSSSLQQVSLVVADTLPAPKSPNRLTVRNNTIVKRGSVSMDQIKKVNIDEVYSVYKQLGTGRFGFVKLAEHKQSRNKIAIKFFPRPQIKQGEFAREYNYSHFLSPHPNVIDTYEGMFQAHDETAYFFVQEFCASASLREAVEGSQTGIGEQATKEVMSRVLGALEFMHDQNLVHRNLKAENILIFDNKNFTRIKITDFGLTRKVDTTVKYLEYVTQYHAPELCETVVNEVLTVRCSIDIWAIGVIFYYCLKGRFPWQKATIMVKPYWEWEQWLKRKIPALSKRWDPFTEKSLKILKKTMNPKPKDRWTAKELRKFIAKEKLLKQNKVNIPVLVYQGNSTVPSDSSAAGLPTASNSGRSSFSAKKSDAIDEYVYYPEEPMKEDKGDDQKSNKKKSVIHQWINSTLNTMAEISEQVVSARDE